MCLLSLNNPSKQCNHSECQSSSVPYHQYLRGNYSEVIRHDDKKRPPIQSISEILAENILKKLKDDNNTGIPFNAEKDKRPPVFYEPNFPISPEAMYFQNQILLLMGQQAQLIQETSKSLDKAVMQVNFMHNEMSKMKDTFCQNLRKIVQNKGKPTKPESDNIPVSPMLIVPKPGKTINKEQLLTQLYGANKSFKYELKLNSNLDTIFYRERNFRFSIVLNDLEGKKVSNINKIPLSLALYTSENLPKVIETNTIGIPILKGSVEKDLVNGVAEFEKLQIKEVTSHFRNGWIFFVVYAKMPSILGKNPKKESEKQNSGIEINFLDIQPLILANVMVKAKKMKKGKEAKIEEGKEEELSESNSKSIVAEEDELVLSEN